MQVIPDPLRGLRVSRQSALRIPYYVIARFSFLSRIIDNGYVSPYFYTEKDTIR